MQRNSMRQTPWGRSLETSHTSFISLKTTKVNLERPLEITGEQAVCERFILPWPLWLTSRVAMTLLKTAVSGSFSPMTRDGMSGDMMSCLWRMYVSMAILGEKHREERKTISAAGPWQVTDKWTEEQQRRREAFLNLLTEAPLFLPTSQFTSSDYQRAK